MNKNKGKLLFLFWDKNRLKKIIIKYVNKNS